MSQPKKSLRQIRSESFQVDSSLPYPENVLKGLNLVNFMLRIPTEEAAFKLLSAIGIIPNPDDLVDKFDCDKCDRKLKKSKVSGDKVSAKMDLMSCASCKLSPKSILDLEKKR